MRASLVLAIVIAIVGRFMSEEVKQWFEWLHRTIRRRAVKKLPPGVRARYSEEWESSLEEVPGEIAKLFYSLSLMRAAIGIRRAALAEVCADDQSLPALKRAFDVVFACAVLSAFAPWMVAIALLIKLSSPGPVFVAESRLGRGGRVFSLFKFRTMAPDPEKSGLEIIHMDDRVFLRATTDRRVTRVGRFLRKYALDELPQFINVLRGEMSIVGPRPRIIGEVTEYLPSRVRRVDATPGITGLWQVQARRNPSFADYLSLNAAYIDGWSLWLDVKILLHMFLDAFRSS